MELPLKFSLTKGKFLWEKIVPYDLNTLPQKPREGHLWAVQTHIVRLHHVSRRHKTDRGRSPPTPSAQPDRRTPSLCSKKAPDSWFSTWKQTLSQTKHRHLPCVCLRRGREATAPGRGAGAGRGDAPEKRAAARGYGPGDPSRRRCHPSPTTAHVSAQQNARSRKGDEIAGCRGNNTLHKVSDVSSSTRVMEQTLPLCPLHLVKVPP